MKYNVVKVMRFPSGNSTIPILINVDFQSMVQELESQNEMQKNDAFQDVSEINHSLDLPFFVCAKNGMSIVYQAEINYFETIADEIKPSIVKKNKVIYPLHQLN